MEKNSLYRNLKYRKIKHRKNKYRIASPTAITFWFLFNLYLDRICENEKKREGKYGYFYNNLC